MPTVNPSMRTLDAIDRIAGFDDLRRIETEVAAALGALGFPYFHILGLPAQLPDTAPVYLLDATPPGLRETYLEGHFYERDHVVRFGKNATGSFRLSTVPYPAPEAKQVRRMFDMMAGFGIRDGIIIPVNRIGEKSCGAAIMGEIIPTDEACIRNAEILILYTAYRIQMLVQNDRAVATANLSPREREVLQWTAWGKTAWEIGEILSISEASVNKFIAAAMAKLDTVSKTQAVAMAIRRHEIDP